MTTAGAEEAPVVLAIDEVDAAGPVPQLRWFLKRLAAMGREHGQEENDDMTTTSEAPATITAPQRATILGYASDILPLRDRNPDAVLAAAAPLLEWAARAVTKDDLRNRMAALSRAHQNMLFLHPAPREFLDDAGLYLEFIAGASA